MARHGENIYKRRDGRYEGRYVIGKTKDGKTRFGYVYARQFAEVRRLLLEKKMQQQKKREYRAKQHIALSDWMKHWLENEILGSIKPSSYQTYHRQINRHLLPHLGGYDLSELTPAIIHDFIEKLANSGLVNRTIKGIYRLLVAALRSAQEQGQIAQNPCRKIKIQHASIPDQRVLTQREQVAIRAFSEPDAELSVLLGLYTGMRLGEICALKWADIDWERRTITVQRTVQRVARTVPNDSGRTMLMIGSPKSTRSQRVLPIPEFLLERLKERMANTTSVYVFGTSNRVAEPRTLQRHLQRCTKGT